MKLKEKTQNQKEKKDANFFLIKKELMNNEAT
jgi:hypothetical protein